MLKTLAFGSNAATSRTVITTAKTTYRVSSTATAAAVSAGRCIAAIGSKASDGTLDAQSITVSSPSGGTCPATSLAGGFGGGQSGQPGGGTPPQDGTNA